MTIGSIRKPMSGLVDYEYQFDTPRAVLAKLKRDLDRFREDRTRGPDHAYSFALSAWGMAGWLWRFDEILRPDAAKRFGYGSFDEFRRFIMLESDAISICADLANGSKHFVLGRVKERPDPDAVAAGPSDTETSTEGDRDDAVVDRSGRPIFIRKILHIRVTDGSVRPAEEILSAAYEYWNEFLKQRRLIEDVAPRRRNVRY